MGRLFPSNCRELSYFWQMSPECRTVLVSAEWLHSKCVMKVNSASPDLCHVLWIWNPLGLIFLEGSNLPFFHVTNFSQTAFVTQDVFAWPFSRSFGMPFYISYSERAPSKARASCVSLAAIMGWLHTLGRCSRSFITMFAEQCLTQPSVGSKNNPNMCLSSWGWLCL